MTAKYTDIEKALVNAVKDLLLPDAAIEYDGFLLSEEEKPSDAIWYAIHNLRAPSTAATVGSAGEDNHPGIFQVDLNITTGKGTGDLTEEGDRLASAFPSGTELTYNGQKVKITGTSLSPSRYVSKYTRISLSILYYARTWRNS